MKNSCKKILVFTSVVAVLWFVVAPVAGAVDNKSKNVENDFLFQLLKEGQTMSIELVSGKELLGRVKRFGDFVVVIEIEGIELLVYKHAIATIKPASRSDEP